jgi:2-haloacid dehalogenase
VKALVFDTFGTVVDWRSSIIREGAVWGKEKNLTIDWGKFAEDWRAGYGPSMDKVRKGEMPWTKLDDLHRMILETLLVKYNITGLTEEDKDHWTKVWHRLYGWPDAVPGLTLTKKHFLISPLSNGNLSLLADMAKFAGLPWDFIFSSDMFRHYKTDPEVYNGAVDLLGYKASEVMMVAAHPFDLKAAQGCGLKAGYVPRPMENGPERAAAAVKAAAAPRAPKPPVYNFDVEAKDFVELARKLSS